MSIELQLELVLDTGVYFGFRDKKSQLYLGYDGFDTDFAKGISPCIQHTELISEFNKKLITKSHLEIVDLLTSQSMGSKEWKQIGGIANIEIIRLEMATEGLIFSPSQLLSVFMSEDTDEIDFQQIELKFE